MSAQTQYVNTSLKALHQCKHCGHFSSREEVPEMALISGVFECPKCGEASSLHVVVVVDEPPKQNES